ncbi:MAG TPA: hypothetical protein ENK18_09025 [Deltaproteobacteria bacterium]|nr:hypothetical protein [Deltaproteobacteria bacterium]
MTEARLEELMVRVVDGLADATERQELMAHLVDRPDLQVELDAHLALKATTDGWMERIGVDALSDARARDPVQRVERAVGLSLILGGISVLAGFWLIELLISAAPLWMKLGTSGVLAGLTILLISVIRGRLATHHADRYSEVIR